MTINRYGEKRSSSFGTYSSTLGDGLTVTQSTMESGWKWKTSSRKNLVSSAVGFSRSTQRKRFVSARSVGIRKGSMSLLCKRPCVVNANERIILTQSALWVSACQVGPHLRKMPFQGKLSSPSDGKHFSGSQDG